MAGILTPGEQSRAELFRQQIARKSAAYVILMNHPDTKKYKDFMDKVEIMIMTGDYNSDEISDAVANESLFLDRFAAIDRAYNELNALVRAYPEIFPEYLLREPEIIQEALQQMKSTSRTGLDAILGLFAYRTGYLLEEILKNKPNSNTPEQTH